MSRITWDDVGKRYYETGVDRGVLYLPTVTGVYSTGFPWNGLTTVTESPSGAESNPQFADNIKYLNLISAEEFGATIEAFTYPDKFAECDGSFEPSVGVVLGQQGRRLFGLSYRTQQGNDLLGSDFGYKIHLMYGCQAAPSEKAYSTINDSPEALTFSWELTTSPIAVADAARKPTALITIDSTKVPAPKLTTFEELLYGKNATTGTTPTPAVAPKLLQPDEVIAHFAA